MDDRADSRPVSFGKYQVTELIGQGGFGRVFKGWDSGLKRMVAIKTCSIQQDDMRARFIREAEIAANLRHANITTVYDFGEEGGEPYLVQEYLPGQDLDHVLARRDPVPLRTRIHYLLQISEGLRYAHLHGVVHRDVKPANIRILDDGQVRIMDFGIAKLVEETQRLTQVGMTIGTAGYLSPEQLLGLDVDTRSDIFSFGILAYELLTYRRPFEADSVSALFYAIAHRDPPPVSAVWADCPVDLARCISRCLEKDRDLRYQDFGDVIQDLAHVDAQLEAKPESPAGAPPYQGVPGPVAVDERRASQAPPEPHREQVRRRLRPYLGLGAAASVVALVAVLSLARWGTSVPESRSTKSEGVVEGPKPEIDSLRPEGSSSETPGPAAAAVVSEQEPVVAQPSTTSARRETTPTPTETPTPAEESAPYRGSGILVLTWSESGDPSAAAAAETALLDELRSRDVEVADPTVLQLLSEDPGARVAARTGDVEALAALAREHGAAVLLTGSLRTQAEPSVGGFFTGTAILDVHAYRIADAQLLKAETYQVGSGDTPGKLGSTALAAETEAAKAVGTQAAVSLGAELSPNRSSP